MTVEEQADLAQHVKRYVYVFYALIFGTLVTVGASYIPFGSHHVNIAVALAIALGKASLVAAFFMHLISERKMVYGLLVFTGIFFLGLMVLTVSAFADFPQRTVLH